MNELFENWNEVKEQLCDGLSNKMKGIVGPLLENQKNHLLNESASAGVVGAHDIAGFRKILIPMIRRIIPGTIAPEIVGVQPMQGPVGLVYSLRYVYNEAVARGAVPHLPRGNVAGQNINPGDELFGNVKAIERFYSGGTDTAQLPGAGGFGHNNADPGAVLGTPVNGNANTLQAWQSSLDAASVGAFGAAGPLHGGSGSFIEGSGGRSIGLKLVSQAVESGTRRLQAGATIEAMQDLNSQHGINIETEFTKALSSEIIQEIDAEVLHDLMALAGTVQAFDFNALPAGFTPTYYGDRYANIGVVINFVANEIARKTRKAGGTFIVVSPMVVSVLQSAAKSVFAPAVQGDLKGPSNTMLVGTLNGQIKVYSYLWNQSQPGAGADVILVGRKGGDGETDSGYFYCPYVPLMGTGMITNPVTYQQSMSLLTRYGKAAFTSTETSLGNSADYYGKITVANVSFT